MKTYIQSAACSTVIVPPTPARIAVTAFNVVPTTGTAPQLVKVSGTWTNTGGTTATVDIGYTYGGISKTESKTIGPGSTANLQAVINTDVTLQGGLYTFEPLLNLDGIAGKQVSIQAIPASIITSQSQNITPGPGYMDVVTTWKNTGNAPGIFIPKISIDGTEYDLGEGQILLAMGNTFTSSKRVAPVTPGPHLVCPVM